MKAQLFTQFQNIVDRASNEDLAILSQWMNGFEKKQSNEMTTYLSAGLHMERTLTADYCRVSIPNTPYIHNTLNIPHGGILAVLLDTAMGILANHSLPVGFASVTTNLSINYVAPAAAGGHIHAQVTLSHKGRQTIVLTGEIKDHLGRLIAIGTGSFFVIPSK
ncbi:PaaI family thioesterase [Paenisporosarcina sp. TG20]|uniref:PaaI family thioesterase n=1 Tax=Paenisporosarcina sp. TG20 TaxID=1211706 RepID=UPI0002F412DC|nr:PaaI family thioesterase [Paenisporosarcina sp. TG20]